MCEVTIRCEGGGFLNIALIGRPHPEASDYWESNWISASVEVKAGGFLGLASGHLRADELAEFHRQLAQVQESLQGTAEFTTMEGWLSIRVEGDGLGHMTCRVVVRNEPGIGNTLDCTLRTDQTFTRSSVAELAAVVLAFPVVGSP
ncbi:MAG: hypothetical protein RMJ82_02620 [Gemmatales bacterium]|nr:hypothetical protein [Gemmatales bacterium]